MVQLPATAAIKYVAACWVSGAGGFLSGGAFVRGSFALGDFFPGGLLPGGTFVRGLMPVPPKFNAYTHRLGFLRLASYRDGQTKKTDKLGPVAPRGIDPCSPNFQGM